MCENRPICQTLCKFCGLSWHTKHLWVYDKDHMSALRIKNTKYCKSFTFLFFLVYRPLDRLWECSQSGGQNKRNFRFCKKNLVVLSSRLAAFSQTCKGSIDKFSHVSSREKSVKVPWPVVSIVKLNFLFKSPGQTESQIDASWRKFSICVRVSFGHPRALSCDDLRWLWSSSNSNASRRKFFTNTCRSQVSCICVNYAFCDLPWTYEQTCESVWPPIASPYASSGFANLRRLASTCESVWPGLKMFLWAEFDNYKLLFLSPLLCYSDHCHTETTAQSNWIITSQKHICISMLHSVQHKKVDTADQKQTSPVGVPS